MNKKILEWKPLKASDIEVRYCSENEKTGKVTLLLYQDSRCTQKALDEQFGTFGWQIDYKDLGGQLYGTLSVYDEEKGVWIGKSDTGDCSNISEKKGQASDILKRCAVRWGFGKELYTAPTIRVPNDGYKCSGYKVSLVDYNSSREIIDLVIVNRFGKVMWTMDSNYSKLKEWYKALIPTVTDKKTVNMIVEFCTEYKDKANTLYNFKPQVEFEKWLSKKNNVIAT